MGGKDSGTSSFCTVQAQISTASRQHHSIRSVINSVVQYFPDIGYLLSVLRGAMGLLTPGGSIFVGDVRHFASLPMFHAAVQLGRAAATVNVGQLRARIKSALAEERELVIDPQFFQTLRSQLRDIVDVEIQMKRGRELNELTGYRYDVVLGVECVTC